MSDDERLDSASESSSDDDGEKVTITRNEDGERQITVDRSTNFRRVFDKALGYQKDYKKAAEEEDKKFDRGMPDDPLEGEYDCETGRFDGQEPVREWDMGHRRQWRIPTDGQKREWIPYAPFPEGGAIEWESNVYDDGTTYEGLTLRGVPTMKGVLVKGNGSGGGLQPGKRGDRYEGEFRFGCAHGLGTYTSADGDEVYQGQWIYGRKHGCGSQQDLTPFRKRIAEGMDPDEAWKASKWEIDANTVSGTWDTDRFISEPDETGVFCHPIEIKGILQQMESVLTRCRFFQFKPDGEVTYMMSQDAVGFPAPLMQDPIHYPHGTKFMAPGPMGQCYPVPDDEKVKDHMIKTVENSYKIFRMYNFDYHTQPGTDQAMAEHYWDYKRGVMTRLRFGMNKIDGLGEVRQQQIRDALSPSGEYIMEEIYNRSQHEKGWQDERPPEVRHRKYIEEIRKALSEDHEEQAAEKQAQKDLSDEDLYASTDFCTDLNNVCYSSEEESEAQEVRQGASQGSIRYAGSTVFASMSLGMSRASWGLHKAFERMSVRAQRRRRLTRPT